MKSEFLNLRPGFLVLSFHYHPFTCNSTLRAILCKNQTKWEMKNFEPPTQIYLKVGSHEECSKMSVIEVIT